MCWVIILIGLVPLLLASAGVSSAVLFLGGSISTHRAWTVISVLLFIGTCYRFAANDNHTMEDRKRTPLNIIGELVTMPDVGLGSSLEIGALLAILISLAYSRMDNKKVAIGTMIAVVLYVAILKQKISGERDRPTFRRNASKEQHTTNAIY
jgi:hypothetical protein